MVAAWAFVATAIATLFAQATLVRYTRGRRRHERAWTVALAMYAAASAALATGEANGWDAGTFRAFYLFGAVLNVVWLGLGTVELLGGERIGRRATGAVLAFSGLAAGIVLAAPMQGSIDPTGGIPSGRELFGAGPRIMAAVGSGVGATVVLAGAVWSAVTAWRRAAVPGARRLAVANALIALGVLTASSGGLLQGLVGHDEAFAVTTATAVAVIYAGFLVATSTDRGSILQGAPGSGRDEPGVPGARSAVP
jgi:hypothetical protein